jgi:hypothetical protein
MTAQIQDIPGSAPAPLRASGNHSDLSWDIYYDPESLILNATLKGRLTIESLISFTEFSQAQAEIHNPCGVIADYRLAELGLSLSDIYGLPEGAEDLGIEQMLPVAVVGTESMMGTGDFAENVFSNRGYTYRAFSDFDSAMSWLREIIVHRQKHQTDVQTVRPG